jgi:hypothetical protein
VTKDKDGVTLESQSITYTILPKDFSTDELGLYHKSKTAPNIIRAEFTTTMAVPSGAVPPIWTDDRGYVEVKLTNTATNWPSDLGISAVVGTTLYCVGVPATGESTVRFVADTDKTLTCTVTKITTNSETVITITNFAALAANTKYAFHIAGVIHTGDNLPITVNTYKINNRFRYELNTKTPSAVETLAALIAATNSAVA